MEEGQRQFKRSKQRVNSLQAGATDPKRARRSLLLILRLGRLERLHQLLLLDRRAAPNVDKDRIPLHRLQLLLPNEFARSLRVGQRANDDIARRKEGEGILLVRGTVVAFGEGAIWISSAGDDVAALGRRVCRAGEGEDFGAVAGGEAGGFTANVAVPDNTNVQISEL